MQEEIYIEAIKNKYKNLDCVSLEQMTQCKFFLKKYLRKKKVFTECEKYDSFYLMSNDDIKKVFLEYQQVFFFFFKNNKIGFFDFKRKIYRNAMRY